MAWDMRLIWVKRGTEYFLRGDWTTQITLIALAFSALCRTSQIVGQRPVRQRFGQMQPPDFLRAIEIGQRPGDTQHAILVVLYVAVFGIADLKDAESPHSLRATGEIK